MARAFSIAASSAIAGMPIAVTAAAWVELAHVDAEVQTAPTFDLSAMWQQFPVLSEPAASRSRAPGAGCEF